MVAHEDFKNHVFVTVSRLTKKKNSNGNPIEDNGGILKVSLDPTTDSAQSQVQKSSDVFSIGKTRTPAGLAISPNGSWLVAIAGHKSYVIRTSDLRSGLTKFVSSDRLTCVAFHPTEEYFGTGDSKGNVKLWYCLNDAKASTVSGVEKRAQTTAFHWHAHAVSSISFTPNGAYLLSGGEESVLVIWQLHTGKKEFVPRVGAPISSISIRPPGEKEEEYLLALSDATYSFVGSGSLKVSRAFSRLKLDPNFSHLGPSTSHPAPLAVHPLTSNLIIPSSHPSSLQVYSTSTSSLLSEIEVSPSNRVSRKDDKPLEPSRVQKTVISASGEWMATVDDRKADESFRAECYLKIWSWDRNSGLWMLNTRIDRPHGLKKVVSIAFSPGRKFSALHLVTTGEDEQIKSWRLKVTKGRSGMGEEFWVPRSSFNFRSQSPSQVSWSRDGSVIAVACGSYVPVYDPVTNALCQVVTCSECKHVVSVQFLGISGRYLAIAGKRDLVLWDLVAQSVRWHHRSAVNIDHLIAHPSEDNLALLQSSSPTSSETKVLMFRPASAIPYQTNMIPFRLLNVTWYPSLAETSKFRLVGITEAWNVVLFGDEVQNLAEAGASPTRIDVLTQKRSEGTTIFQEMFGISSFARVERPLASHSSLISTAKGQGQAATTILDVPAYLMPPLESLFQPLINGFLQPRTLGLERNLPAGVEGQEEVEVEMEVDEPVNLESRSPFIAGAKPQRVVDAREMNDFVELFRHHGLTSSKPRRITFPQSRTNGVRNNNGISKYPLNGASTPPFHKINGKTANSASQSTSPIPTSSSPATTGKKRKKSFGEATR